MDAAALTAALKEESLRLGFDLAGATPAVPSPDFERLQKWLAGGYQGEMRYFAERLDAYRHPAGVLEGAKSILMLATNYRTVEPAEPGEGQGTVPIFVATKMGLSLLSQGQARVSRHAWGVDYHEVIRGRIHKLADFHRSLTPSAQMRGVVDTAPLLEKQFARLAGLGGIGKNTLLIHPRFGSWMFLAALLTTEELAYDPPCETDLCGSCRACLDACPTGALDAPFHLDARKCISYLTIEAPRVPLLRRSSVEDFNVRNADCRRRLLTPMAAVQEDKSATGVASYNSALLAACGNRLYGCDACQEACPWNRDTPSTSESAFQPIPGMNPVDLAELQALDEESFRRRFRHTPLWRIRSKR
jgi:epoxyqueuosine reductase